MGKNFKQIDPTDIKQHLSGTELVELKVVKEPYRICRGCFRDQFPKRKMVRGIKKPKKISGRPLNNNFTRKKSIKHQSIAPILVYQRTCLKCRKEFKALSKFNRICADCNEVNSTVSAPKVYNSTPNRRKRDPANKSDAS